MPVVGIGSGDVNMLPYAFYSGGCTISTNGIF